MSANTALGMCESLHSVLPDLCAVLVTHIPSLAQRCDDVVVLSGGIVAGQGRGDVLLKTCAEYRALVGNPAPDRIDNRPGSDGHE
jgi:ABC-type multidrug transport system fused ATPase/permease subunit